MVPWRVAQGERLYRDVHFPSRPARGLARRRPSRRALRPVATGAHGAGGDCSRSCSSSPSGRIASAALSILARGARDVARRLGGRLSAARRMDVPLQLRLRHRGRRADVGRRCRRRDRRAPPTAPPASACSPRRSPASRWVWPVSRSSRWPCSPGGRPSPAAPGVLPPRRSAAAYGAVSYGVPRERLIADGWLRVLSRRRRSCTSIASMPAWTGSACALPSWRSRPSLPRPRRRSRGPRGGGLAGGSDLERPRGRGRRVRGPRGRGRLTIRPPR